MNPELNNMEGIRRQEESKHLRSEDFKDKKIDLREKSKRMEWKFT